MPAGPKLKILYDCPRFMLIEKPAALHSVSLRSGGGASLAQLLRRRWPVIEQASLRKEDAGLVNRLDFETSGILICAKDRAAWLKLHDMLLKEKIKKSYLAVLEGEISARRVIETYIGASGRNARKVKVVLRESKKLRTLAAKSLVVPLAFNRATGLSLVKFRIGPGRRHQIRAHSAFIGHPLAGDSLYGSKVSLTTVLSPPLPTEVLPRFLLHAQHVSFRDPWSGRSLNIESSLPAFWPEFQDLRSR